jgi:hypothetical protein
MFRYLRYIIITTTLFLTNLSSYAYNDPFGFYSEVVAYEKQIISKYDLSPYIKAQIHNIAEKFISDCTKKEPGEIAGAIFRDVAMSRMKDMAEKFHFSRRIDLLSDLQNAQWIDLGYPEKIGTRDNYLLRTDLGFNNRYDCIVIHEVTNGMALAHNPLRVIDGTQYILQEYSFYDNFSQMGEGNRYFVSINGDILFVEKLYDEDYLFGATQFDSITPLYSHIIKTIKNLNRID